MSTNKHIQILRSSAMFQTLDAAKSAMSATTVLPGECIVAYYQDNGEDHVLLGIGPKTGGGESYFMMASKLKMTSKIK